MAFGQVARDEGERFGRVEVKGRAGQVGGWVLGLLDEVDHAVVLVPRDDAGAAPRREGGAWGGSAQSITRLAWSSGTTPERRSCWGSVSRGRQVAVALPPRGVKSSTRSARWKSTRLAPPSTKRGSLASSGCSFRVKST